LCALVGTNKGLDIINARNNHEDVKDLYNTRRPLCVWQDASLSACLTVEDRGHKKIKSETWNFTGILGRSWDYP